VYSSYSFTTSALDGGEWSASRPGRTFTPGERTPDTHCTGGWVGPRAGLDTEARGKNPLPLPGIEPRSPGRPARSQTLYCLSYPGSLANLNAVIIRRSLHTVPTPTPCLHYEQPQQFCTNNVRAESLPTLLPCLLPAEQHSER
jgi:hypothetical protein